MSARTPFEDWWPQAACRNHPDLPLDAWLEKPDDGYWGTGPNAAAIAVCRACPVANDCLLYQLDFEGQVTDSARHGIFGATTPAQRARLAKQAGVPRRSSHPTGRVA